MRLQERLFRVVIRLYPAEFRERFGGDMAEAYREARMDAAMRGRPHAALHRPGATVTTSPLQAGIDASNAVCAVSPVRKKVRPAALVVVAASTMPRTASRT